MKSKPQVTLRDIAHAAAVSHMTVSLALRNDPRITTPTRLRIQKLADDMGYRPNPAMSDLMTRMRTRRTLAQDTVIAHLSAVHKPGGWREYYPGRDYIEGAAQRARELGYQLEEFWLREPGMTSRRMTQILKTRGIRGVLVGGLISVVGHMSLDWSGFAVATLGYSVRLPQLHRVVPDYVHNVSLAVRELRRHGYRRIGLMIWSPIDIRTAHRTTAGFLAIQHHMRATDRVPLLKPRTLDEPTFARWFTRHRPEVVIGSDSRIHGWLGSLGQRVPQDVGFVHLSKRPSEPFAGIDHNAPVIGAAAIDLIVGQLQQNEFGLPKVPKVVHIRGEWVDGPTVRKV
jgi:LacI family transcriptional regulator